MMKKMIMIMVMKIFDENGFEEYGEKEEPEGDECVEPSDDEEGAELGRSSAFVFKALNRIVASPAAAAAGASSSFNRANSSRPPDFSQPKSKTKQNKIQCCFRGPII